MEGIFYDEAWKIVIKIARKRKKAKVYPIKLV